MASKCTVPVGSLSSTERVEVRGEKVGLVQRFMKATQRCFKTEEELKAFTDKGIIPEDVRANVTKQTKHPFKSDQQILRFLLDGVLPRVEPPGNLIQMPAT